MHRHLPEQNADYRTADYWDRRYLQEGESDYDWFLDPSQLIALIQEFAPQGQERILMLGAGNSELSEALYKAGYHDIFNIDFSKVLLEQMTKRHSDKPKMKWIYGDVRHLDSIGAPLENGTFDLAIDKGTMDALLTGQKSVWDIDHDVAQECRQEVMGVRRLLKEGKPFLHVTWAQPHFRVKLLCKDVWSSFEQRSLGGSEATFGYFAYIMTK